MVEAGKVTLEEFQIRGEPAAAAPPPRGRIEDDEDPTVGAAQIDSISSKVCTPARYHSSRIGYDDTSSRVRPAVIS